MQSIDAPIASQPPSARLRTWLIIVTVLAALGLIAAIPGVLFGTYMAAFAADDPSASTDAVMNIMFTVWAIGGCYVLLLIAGVAGAWIAYRKRRNRLSFGLSLLVAVPIFLILLGLAAIVVINSVWSARILSTPL
ncbi:MAG TPA: FtsX-like permease family protein [Anaerolineales bacterium]